MNQRNQLKAVGRMALLAVFVLALQSCFDDDGYDDEHLLFSIGTVQVIEGQD